MISIKLGNKILQRHLGYFVIVAVLLALLCYIAVSVFAAYADVIDGSNVAQELLSYNAVLTRADMSGCDRAPDKVLYHKNLSLNGFGTVTKTLTVMPKEYLNAYTLDFAEGGMPKQAITEEGYLNIIVSEAAELKLGELKTVGIVQYGAETQPLTIKVAGVVSQKSYYPCFTKYALPLTAEGNLISKAETYEFIMLAIDCPLLESYHADLNRLYIYNTPSDAESAASYALLRDDYAVPFAKIRDNETQLIKENVRIYIPIILCILLLTLTVVVTFTDIILKESTKETAVLTQIGGGKRELYRALFSLWGSVFVAAVIIFLFLFLFLGNIISSKPLTDIPPAIGVLCPLGVLIILLGVLFAELKYNDRQCKKADMPSDLMF